MTSREGAKFAPSRTTVLAFGKDSETKNLAQGISSIALGISLAALATFRRKICVFVEIAALANCKAKPAGMAGGLGGRIGAIRRRLSPTTPQPTQRRMPLSPLYRQQSRPWRRLTTLMRPSDPVRHFCPLRNQRFFCSRLHSGLLVERLGTQTRLTPLAFAAASFLPE